MLSAVSSQRALQGSFEFLYLELGSCAMCVHVCEVDGV